MRNMSAIGMARPVCSRKRKVEHALPAILILTKQEQTGPGRLIIDATCLFRVHSATVPRVDWFLALSVVITSLP